MPRQWQEDTEVRGHEDESGGGDIPSHEKSGRRRDIDMLL